MSKTIITSVGDIHKRIYTLPGVQVMLDEDLVELSSVESRAINKAFKWNIVRLPSEFMFQLNDSDPKMNRSQFVTTSNDALRSQFATLKTGSGQHRKYPPYVFTEQGVDIMEIRAFQMLDKLKKVQLP